MVNILKISSFLSLLFIFSFLPVISQEEEEEYHENIIDYSIKKSNYEKLLIGGNFSLTLGTITNIELSPTLGYMLSKNFSINAGPLFEYYANFYDKINYTIFGFKAFLRYFVYNNLYLHIENESLIANRQLQLLYNINSNSQLYIINNFLAGGGFRRPFVGKKGGIYLSVLWYVYPYFDYNPKIRIDFMF
jgi:hypothetical protein